MKRQTRKFDQREARKRINEKMNELEEGLKSASDDLETCVILQKMRSIVESEIEHWLHLGTGTIKVVGGVVKKVIDVVNSIEDLTGIDKGGKHVTKVDLAVNYVASFLELIQKIDDAISVHFDNAVEIQAKRIESGELEKPVLIEKGS